ncbi:type II secretion system protein [Virgibacillus sp. W0181]|uniref:type II secretion system protein n=1 Tax=Virgibacillus sp. W0181 TaxID=3391581 RepID=UPI003F4711FE
MRNMSDFRNEDGITLVELLASIAILTIVVALLYSFIFQGLNSEKKTSDAIALNQDGNVLISELRSQYYAGETMLCVETDDKRLTIDDYTITNGDTPLQIDQGCIEGVNTDEPLEIKLTLGNDLGQSITLEATWQRPESAQLALVVGSSGEGGSNPDNITWEYTTDELPCLDNPDYKNLNIKWTGDKLESNCKQYNGPNKNKHGTNKSLWIKNDVDLEDKNFVKVGQHLFTNEKVELEDNATVTVDGNATFNKKVEVSNNAFITIGANSKFQRKLEMEGQSLVRIGGSANFVKKLSMENSARFESGGNSIFSDKIEMEDSASIVIGGSATCLKKVTKENNASITVSGKSTCS